MTTAALILPLSTVRARKGTGNAASSRGPRGAAVSCARRDGHDREW